MNNPTKYINNNTMTAIITSWAVKQKFPQLSPGENDIFDSSKF